MTLYDRIRATYPDDFAALQASFETPLGLPRPVQFVVDSNSSFLERLVKDGLTLEALTGVINGSGFAAVNHKPLGRKTLASALTRARARVGPAATGPLQAARDGKEPLYSPSDGPSIAPDDDKDSHQSASDCLCPQMSAVGRAEQQSAAVDCQARRQDADIRMQPRRSVPVDGTSEPSTAHAGRLSMPASDRRLPHRSAQSYVKLHPNADVKDGLQPSEDGCGETQTSEPDSIQDQQYAEVADGRRTASNDQESRAEARERGAARLPFSNRSSFLGGLSCQRGVELLKLEDENENDGIE